MSEHQSQPTRRHLPLILIGGFGNFSTDDEKKSTYLGFNIGSAYHHKKGENHIYEGMILRFLKSDWQYQDATNVVFYRGKEIESEPIIPRKIKYIEEMSLQGEALPYQLQRLKDQGIVEKFQNLQANGLFSGNRVIVDPTMALKFLESTEEPYRSVWVFRYYDLDKRNFESYGNALVRLIDCIREVAADEQGVKPKVNIIAYSMGGLVIRQAIQETYPQSNLQAEDYINKVVTLGTPHRGITFQLLQDWLGTEAEKDLERMNPQNQDDIENPNSFWNFKDYFPLERLLTVVGTNYRPYHNWSGTWLNRLFSEANEYGLNYNRSDGLVKQFAAQIPGAPRTFVHKCHGGFDSLITSRESFEVATRFLFGNVRVRLRMVKAQISRGKDLFGKSEFFLGVSIKPRGVDFELFHQSKDAENCYGPFSEENLSDENLAFPWADDNKLIWEGYLDTIPIWEDESIQPKDLVIRLDVYVGERDLLGIGFSDNLIFREQYYIRALLTTTTPELYLHKHELFALPDFQPERQEMMRMVENGWHFDVLGTGFKGRFCIEIDRIPEQGQPEPLI
ncbi:MAG: hypothetical protein F6J89_22935 [Symploca sp. SIO1C4]|uniref:DUF676 domain-containing protein n=1 Tax=Symploca sp. SIO1C4 TaxID=2607765 RepID=A0A6B3NFI4_9CYAN|nr:hypothetical protein [Symploca sp. SIO1C4]